MQKATFLSLCLVLTLPRLAEAADPPSAEPEARRESAVAEFTRKMQAANYPALFEQAAREFQVPGDILKGIAFAETRWEHLTWPPGELVSPDNGMPRPYGIMSLWDNRYFGHSLLDAAGLIGQDPELLKQDPLQNIRGAAALLRKLYNETPKPEGTAEGDLESWRYAIRKYCGIPEPDLNARHALDIYTFINQGYHQFGIDWNAHRVNLEPIRQETLRIVAEEEAKRAARLASGSNAPALPPPQLVAATKSEAELEAQRIPDPAVAQAPARVPAVAPEPARPSERSLWWFIGGALLALLALTMFSRREPNPPEG